MPTRTASKFSADFFRNRARMGPATRLAGCPRLHPGPGSADPSDRLSRLLMHQLSRQRWHRTGSRRDPIREPKRFRGRTSSALTTGHEYGRRRCWATPATDPGTPPNRVICGRCGHRVFRHCRCSDRRRRRVRAVSRRPLDRPVLTPRAGRQNWPRRDPVQNSRCRGGDPDSRTHHDRRAGSLGVRRAIPLPGCRRVAASPWVWVYGARPARRLVVRDLPTPDGCQSYPQAPGDNFRPPSRRLSRLRPFEIWSLSSGAACVVRHASPASAMPAKDATPTDSRRLHLGPSPRFEMTVARTCVRPNPHPETSASRTV